MSNDWGTMFGSYLDSGVSRLGGAVDEAAIEAAAVAAGLDFVRVDFHGEVYDKTSFLATFAVALDFPPYFGMNWDALHECLTDMSWRPAAGYVLLLAGVESMPESSGSLVQTAMRVLEAAAAYWKEREVPFFVLLSA